MPQVSITKCVGLVTQYNPLHVTDGALVVADDCVIRRENVVENRRGYASYGTLSNQPTQLMVYSTTILAHNSTTISYDNGSGTFAAYTGSYSAPGGRLMRFQTANSNLYITTSLGVKVLMDTTNTNTPRLAGAPRCLQITSALTGGSGFLSNNKQCSYRAIIKRTDANLNVIIGYPSERLWVSNTAGGSRNTTITVYIPSDSVATTDVIEVYRSAQLDYTAGNADSAGDEPGLIYRYTLTSSDISNGYISFTDSVVDALIGAFLYSNASQEGITQANAVPPLAKDIALFKNTMFFANTATKQRLFFSMISASGQYNSGSYAKKAILGVASTTATTTNGSPDITVAATTNIVAGLYVYGTGIPANTTVLSIASSVVTLSANASASGSGVYVAFGVPFTSAAAENSATGAYIAYGTGTTAYDISQTARSLCNIINRYALNTYVYAYYVSGSTDLPGQILLEARDLSASAFYLMAGDSTVAGDFFPKPGTAGSSTQTTTATTSSNTTQRNGLYYSKSNQPEAVPLLNYFLVGPANDDILRIAPLRDSLIIVKSSGVYRLTGETPSSFSIVPLDLTVFCKAVDSVTILANQVFMLSNQGVVAVSDTGVQAVSREIEPNLLPLLSFSGINSYTYGCAYESERSYLLSVPSSSTDTAPNQTYVYNIFTRAWTRWTFGFMSAIVEPNGDKLYFTKSSYLGVYKERKDFANDDYSDPEYSITIGAISGSNVTFTISSVTPIAGWVMSQSGTNIRVDSIAQSGSSWIATLDSTPPSGWTTGAATLYPAISMVVEWDAFAGGDPGLLKQLQDFKILTDNISTNDTISSLSATFRTDLDRSRQSVEIDSNSVSWGNSPWGAFEWGGISETFDYRTYPPQTQSYFRILNPGVMHSNAKEKISVNGFSTKFRVISERTTK